MLKPEQVALRNLPNAAACGLSTAYIERGHGECLVRRIAHGSRMNPLESQRDYSEFWADVEQLAGAHREIDRLKAEIERAIALRAAETRAGGPHAEQVVLRALRDRQAAARGGLVFRVFWWGFHLEIASPDLDAFCQDKTRIVDTLESIAGSAPALAPHLLAAIGFLNVYLTLLCSIDAGKGIYVGMLWNAPGLFVPSPVK